VKSTVVRPQIIYGPSRGSDGSTAGVSVAMREAAQGGKYTIPFKGRTFFHFSRDVGRFVGRALLETSEDFELYNLPGESLDVEDISRGLNKRFGKNLIDCEDVVYPFAEGLKDESFCKKFEDVDVTCLADVLDSI